MEINDRYKTEFLKIIPLLEAEEFIGLCKILNVVLVNDDEPRDFVNLFEDVLKAFLNLNRKQRRNLMKILRNATKGKKLNKKETIDVEDTSIAADPSKDSITEENEVRTEN